MDIAKKRYIRRAAKYLILFTVMMISSKKLTDLSDKDAFTLACIAAITFAITDILSPSISK